jgi:hypothetical protein
MYLLPVRASITADSYSRHLCRPVVWPRRLAPVSGAGGLDGDEARARRFSRFRAWPAVRGAGLLVDERSRRTSRRGGRLSSAAGVGTQRVAVEHVPVVANGLAVLEPQPPGAVRATEAPRRVRMAGLLDSDRDWRLRSVVRGFDSAGNAPTLRTHEITTDVMTTQERECIHTCGLLPGWVPPPVIARRYCDGCGIHGSHDPGSTMSRDIAAS